MTKEEAIKYIKYCMCIGRLVGNTKPIIDEKWQAGEMAIKALEQKPCEDAISREAVKNVLPRQKFVAYEAYLRCIAEIDNLPSVTPIRPKGHWILTDVEGDRVWHCNCSECGKDPQDYVGGSENWWLIKGKLPKFCPSCASDMREVEDV